MKKSFTGIIAAAITAVTMLSPLTTNAYWVIDGDVDDLERMVQGYTLVENVTFFEWTLYEGKAPSEGYYVFVNDDGSKFFTFDKIKDAKDIHVKLADEVSKEDVENALYEEYNDGYEKVQFWLESDPTYDGYYFLMRNLTHSEITMQEAVEYLEFMKDNNFISEGKIINNEYNMNKITQSTPEGLSSYEIIAGNADLYERFSSFVEKELEGYHTEISFEGQNYCDVLLVPPEGATLLDKIEAAQKVYEATNLSPHYGRQLAIPPKKESRNGIDVYNAIKGDANCDGKVTIADPVAILQNIANKDKYGLSAQGKFNGDVTGEYDGLTAADAYELQVVDSQK